MIKDNLIQVLHEMEEVTKNEFIKKLKMFRKRHHV